MREVKGDLCHQLLRQKITPKLSFDENADFSAYKKELKEKFVELFGINNIKQNACPLNMEIEYEEQKEGFKKIRFVFDSEYGATVPCYLLIPDTGKDKYPLVITLQGHSEGFHYSIGETKRQDPDAIEYAQRGNFAVQAVRRGFAALAIENRGMGERRPNEPHQKSAQMFEYTSHIALLLGRTILGERIWDVSKAIDALESFSQIDLNDITITGNSGGGTLSFYAACYDERIKHSAPSCSFCTYEHSIMHWYHCSCNFVPHAYEWFEMQDLSALIAPRKLSVITGEIDPIFPLHGVKTAYETVEKIYAKAGAPNNCSFSTTPKGHAWVEDVSWTAILEARK